MRRREHSVLYAARAVLANIDALAGTLHTLYICLKILEVHHGRHPPPIGSSQRTARQLLEEIVRSQHHRSFGIDWRFEELTRCSLLNRIAQSHKLIYSLICLHIMLAFKIVHCRGADRTPHHVALIKHREINDHPIEVVAQYFTSLQRHSKSSALKGSDYAMSAGLARCAANRPPR